MHIERRQQFIASGRSHIAIVLQLALFTKLLQIGAHPIHWEKVNGNPQKTGQFYIIWRAWQNCVFWRYMEVMTSNIDLFCHDCSLRISSCMNDILALLYCDHPIKQFALCRRRTIKHYCMILSSMRASPIVDLTLTQLATTAQWWTKLIIRIAWMMSAPIKERPHQHQGGVCLFI